MIAVLPVGGYLEKVHAHLTPEQASCIRQTAELLAERPSELTRRFYEMFFSRFPEVRELFGSHSQADQARMLHETLIAALDHLEDARWLETTMRALGHRHHAYEVTPEMYDWFITCLLDTFKLVLGDSFTAAHQSAWHVVLERLCSMMKRAAEEL